jgi:hypothetical protein
MQEPTTCRDEDDVQDYQAEQNRLLTQALHNLACSLPCGSDQSVWRSILAH